MMWPVPMVFLIGSALTLISSLIFYEASRLTSRHLPDRRWHPHLIASVAIMVLFTCHAMSITLYAFAYSVLQQASLDLGALVSPEAFPGQYDGSFSTIMYFSAATYTSLGYGDIVPHGALRILAAIQALNGLVLIGWSASFGYLLMRDFWSLHGKPEKKKARR